MVAVAASLWEALASSGWSLKDEEKKNLAEEVQANASLSELQKVVLNCDLRKVGAPALPEDINRVAQATLQGPLVVQVVSMADISQPSRASAESGSSSGRLLRLKVTDGKLTATCIEFRPIGHLKAAIAPGTKLLVKGKSQIRNGVVLLEPKNVEVVGGRVESLAEAWEVQQKYGGLDRLRPQGAEASEIPPPFEHFNIDRKSKATKTPGPTAGSPKQKVSEVALQADPDRPPVLPPGLDFPRGGGRVVQGAKRGRHGGRCSGQRSSPGPTTDPLGGSSGARHGEPCRAGGHGARGGREARAAPGRPHSLPTGSHDAAVVGGGEQPDLTPVPRAEQQQLPAQPQQHSRLKGKLAAGEQQRREELEESRQRRQKARMRRRGLDDDADGVDDSSLTLQEWEARQQARQSAPSRAPDINPYPSSSSTQMVEDEKLARELQRQMELEDSGVPLQGGGPTDLAQDLRNSLFSFARAEEVSGYDGGRGHRGRGRGGRGRGRGRGCT